MSELDPFDLDGEATRNADAQASVKREAEWEVEDLRRLMGIKWGRRIMHRLLTHAGVYRLSFDPSNASVTAFNEGQRNQGQRLLSLIMAHCSDDYALMVQERSNVRS